MTRWCCPWLLDVASTLKLMGRPACLGISILVGCAAGACPAAKRGTCRWTGTSDHRGVLPDRGIAATPTSVTGSGPVAQLLLWTSFSNAGRSRRTCCVWPRNRCALGRSASARCDNIYKYGSVLVCCRLECRVVVLPLQQRSGTDFDAEVIQIMPAAQRPGQLRPPRSVGNPAPCSCRDPSWRRSEMHGCRCPISCSCAW